MGTPCHAVTYSARIVPVGKVLDEWIAPGAGRVRLDLPYFGRLGSDVVRVAILDRVFRIVAGTTGRIGFAGLRHRSS